MPVCGSSPTAPADGQQGGRNLTGAREEGGGGSTPQGPPACPELLCTRPRSILTGRAPRSEEKAEVQRGEVVCPRSPSYRVAE